MEVISSDLQQERLNCQNEWNFDRCLKNGGDYQYRVLCPERYAVNGEIYLFAQTTRISSDGALSFYGRDNYMITSFAAGAWEMCHICSAIDATPTNIYYWDRPDSSESCSVEAQIDSDNQQAKQYQRKPIGDSLRFNALEKSGFKCTYCGRSAHQCTLEVDHIVPVAKGGTNDLSNLQAICKRCNQGKSTKMVKPSSGAFEE